MRSNFLLTILLILALIAPASTQIKKTTPDTARLQLLLKKLTIVGNALYMGAHPDDENTAILATLSLGRFVRAGYLALNRGEGGQNLIGNERGELLGLIRTQELLAARNVDYAEQFFTRAVDFGYSKSAEESLRFWGKDAVLADVVWVYRTFRPDVVITRFPTEGESHGHHIASAILAKEALEASGDPSKFPEQLKYTTVWKPKRVVWNRYSRTNQPLSEEEKRSLAQMEIGDYNTYLGKSYTELAGISRSMHKSQGFGDSEDRGRFTQYFELLAGEPAQKDLFEGIDLSWNRIPGGAEVGKILDRASKNFNPAKPADTVPDLLAAYREISKIEKNPWAETKKADVLEAIRACTGLWLEAIAAQDSASPGSEIQVDATAILRSEFPLQLESVQIGSRRADGATAPLTYNNPVTKKLNVSIASNANYSHPYWLGESSKPFSPVKDQLLIGRPEAPTSLEAQFVIMSGTDKLVFTEPVLFRRVDPVRGETYKAFAIVPEVALNIQDPVAVFGDMEPKKIRVQAISGSAVVESEVRLILPNGWKSEPTSLPFTSTVKDETKILTFNVRPANGATSGEFRAEATIGDRKISNGKITIDYPHIPVQTLFPPSKGQIIRVDLKKAGKNLGYIAGSGDAIPEALQQIGYQVTPLTDDALASKDLSQYDAILVGIRAYNTRTALKDVQDRLLQYVEQGGTMVVQYQTSQDLVTQKLGPYSFQLSRKRVSVEDAPVTILAQNHSLMNFPNRITQSDFDGWVQERGLYFPDQWDPKYETVFSSADPNEEQLPGGTLFTRYGKGTYIYTAYSWFRELPAGVPGAYRLFVNMISAGKSQP